MILRTPSCIDCLEGPVATLVFSGRVLRGRVSVAPLWSCPFHLTAGVCGLPTDMLHGGIALCLVPLDLRVPCSEGLASADPECAMPLVAINLMERPAKLCNKA